jgi:hypothetical protein
MLGQRLRGAKVVMAIHNLAHQGLFSLTSFKSTGLPQSQHDALVSPASLPTPVAGPMQQGGDAAQQPQVDTHITGEQEDQQGQASQQGQQEGTEVLRGGGVKSAGQAAQQPSAGLSAAQGTSVDAAAIAKADAEAGTSPATPGGEASTPGPQRLSWLHAAVMESDLVLTVSEQYAEEIKKAAQSAVSKQPTLQQQAAAGVQLVQQQGKRLPEGQQAQQLAWQNPGGQVTPRGGADPATAGLLASLQQKQIRGILNGIDTYVWSPSADYYLPRSLWYTGKDVHEKKAAAKALLQVRVVCQHACQ